MTALPAHPAHLPERGHSHDPVEASHPLQVVADAVEVEHRLREKHEKRAQRDVEHLVVVVAERGDRRKQVMSAMG